MNKMLRLLQCCIVCCCMAMSSILWAQPQFDWAGALGGGRLPFSYEVFATDVVSDKANNMYLSGTFLGTTIDFDPGPGVENRTSVNTRAGDGYVTKYDSSGKLLWAKTLLLSGTGISANSGVGVSIAGVDAMGNVYAYGTFQDTIDFDPGSAVYHLSSPGEKRTYLLKLNANGDFVWAKTLWQYKAYTIGFVLDGQGNIYCGGSFNNNSIDFDPGLNMVNLTTNGKYDAYVVKLDTSANFIWAKNVGGTDDDEFASLRADQGGNVYLTGSFRKTADFDPGPSTQFLTNDGKRDKFVLKLDSSGKFGWVKPFFNTQSMAIDDFSNIFLTYINSIDSIDYDPGPGTFYLARGGVALSKLDSSGNFLWAKRALVNKEGNTSLGEFTETDVLGNVYIAGTGTNSFSGTLLFAPDDENNNDNTRQLDLAKGRMYITKFDTHGKFIWAINMGDTANGSYASSFSGMGLGVRGTIYSIGTLGSRTNDFDPGPKVISLSPAGSGNGYGAFFHKMKCPLVIENRSVIACLDYDFFGTSLTKSGTYTHMLPNVAGGCDSVVELTLTIAVIDAGLTENEGILKANIANAAYQWVNCSTGNIIADQSDQSFTPTADGDYAVIITQSGCSDTSACMKVKIKEQEVRVNELGKDNVVVLYPNPSAGTLHLKTGRSLSQASAKIYSITGRQVGQYDGLAGQLFIFDVSSYAGGVYFIVLKEQDHVVRLKFSIR